jgi:hypothetical protein
MLSTLNGGGAMASGPAAMVPSVGVQGHQHHQQAQVEQLQVQMAQLTRDNTDLQREVCNANMYAASRLLE